MVIKLVKREDCKYFYYGIKKLYGIDKPTANIIKMPMCKINKNIVGGCHKNCQWFEPKTPEM